MRTKKPDILLGFLVRKRIFLFSVMNNRNEYRFINGQGK